MGFGCGLRVDKTNHQPSLASIMEQKLRSHCMVFPSNFGASLALGAINTNFAYHVHGPA